MTHTFYTHAVQNVLLSVKFCTTLSSQLLLYCVHCEGFNCLSCVWQLLLNEYWSSDWLIDRSIDWLVDKDDVSTAWGRGPGRIILSFLRSIDRMALLTLWTYCYSIMRFKTSFRPSMSSWSTYPTLACKDTFRCHLKTHFFNQYFNQITVSDVSIVFRYYFMYVKVVLLYAATERR